MICLARGRASSAVPQVCLAGLAVRLAPSDISVPAVVVSSGVLPWLVQTSLRTEIYAFLAAAYFATKVGAQVRMWTDCQGVLRRATGLLEGTWQPRPASANSDLWKRVQLVMGDLVARLTVHKVASHMGHAEASDVVDAWAFLNNDDVDKFARASNLQRPQDFCELSEDVRKDYSLQEMVGRATVRVHAAVASSAVGLSKVQELASSEVYLPTVEEAVQFPQCPDRNQPRLWTRYGRPYIEAVYSWMQNAFANDQVADEPLRWISVVHHLFSFHKFTGVVPPWCDSRTRSWTSIGQFTRPELVRPHVGVQSAFCRHLGACVVAQVGVWLTADRRPHSSALQIKVRTVPVHFSTRMLESIDEHS